MFPPMLPERGADVVNEAAAVKLDPERERELRAAIGPNADYYLRVCCPGSAACRA